MTNVSMAALASLVGLRLDNPAVVAFFLNQPATARRRRQGRTDLSGIRSLSSEQHGYVVAHSKGRIDTVFLYLCHEGDYSPFRGELISGLSVDDSREDVRAKLGPATRSGAADKAGVWLWDRYDLDALCVHIAYGKSGMGLRRITLMAPDVAP
jgi:hypothetical protein